MSEILLTVFLVLAIAMTVLILVLVCANLYEIFEEPDIQRRMRKLRTSTQPWVTVLLYARNDAMTIEASLNALVKSRYLKYDIVVINDRSGDTTKKRIENFRKTNPKIPLTILNRKKAGSVKAALQAAYKKSKKGEVIISLRSGTYIPSDFIKRAVAKKGEKELVTLRIHDSPTTNTLSGITHSLHNFLWLQSHAAFVSDAQHITPTKLEVRPDLIAILAFVGMIVVSILTQEAIIIWYTWILVTVYLCSVIWLKNEGLMTKIKLTFSALSALFLLPVSSLIQGISQFRSRI